MNPTHNLLRNFKYLFWTLLEQVSSMAIPRLVLFPLAAYMIGKESFGVFMTALSISLIVGFQPANGLATALLRHLSDYSDIDKKQFCGIAMRMCHLGMTVTIVIGILVVFLVAQVNLVSWRLAKCIIPLVLSLYPENQLFLILTEYRYRRDFKNRALWFLVRSTASLLLGLAGAYVADAFGLAWGYFLGNLIIYVIVRLRHQQWLNVSQSAEMKTVLKKVWLQMTFAGIIAVSGPYLNRIILSGFYSYENVADLVAATSVTYIFLAPVTCIGGLILSMISKCSSVNLIPKSTRFQLMLFLLLGITILPIAFKLLSSYIMRILYPTFGQSSIILLDILVWIILAESIANISRPFVMKFASIKFVPIINSITILATIIPALCLIPKHGTAGAAWSIVIGSIVTALLWFAGMRILFLKPELITGKSN